MATVKLILERSRTLNDGSYPLVFQIIHRRAKKLIYTSFRIREQEFDLKSERVVFTDNQIRTKNDVSSINSKIKKQRKCINDHILELDRRGCSYAVAEITFRYRIENDSLSLMGYFDLQIKQKQTLDKLGTLQAYKSTRASVARFINLRHMRISEVNTSFVAEYERSLITSGISHNTICFYIRNFKSIYNQAVIDGYPLPEKSPFKYVQTKPQTTTKRALDRAALICIRELNLDGRKILKLARDLFLFSFYSRGMAMVDMSYLTHSDINNGVISYRRHKTNQQLEVAVTGELSEIIGRYKSDSDYIFPILEGEDPEELYRQHRVSLERTNRHLKEIGTMLKLTTPLTTYVARHSWATEAKKCGIQTSVISEGLGHTSEKTTQIYLKTFDRSTLDKANQRVTSLSRR